MVYGSSAIWKCMFAKSLFVENNLFFPNCHGEAKAIYALLLALSGNIVNVQEGLYYYRRFREGSLTGQPRIHNGDENAVGLLAADYLFQGFQNCGLYGKHKEMLQKSIIMGLSDRLAGLFYRKNGCLSGRRWCLKMWRGWERTWNVGWCTGKHTAKNKAW